MVDEVTGRVAVVDRGGYLGLLGKTHPSPFRHAYRKGARLRYG